MLDTRGGEREKEGVKQVLEESGKSGMSAGWVVARCRSSLGKESAVGWF